jgi:hypothetical protein
MECDYGDSHFSDGTASDGSPIDAKMVRERFG